METSQGMQLLHKNITKELKEVIKMEVNEIASIVFQYRWNSYNGRTFCMGVYTR